MQISIRYELPDENDETRRERNERMEVYTPELIIPECGTYLWEMYNQISDQLIRVRDSVCMPIPWSEFLAWQSVTATIVSPDEFEILFAMDEAFVAEMNIELQDYNEREKEKRERELEAAQRRR